jgi:hypothetical protein
MYQTVTTQGEIMNEKIKTEIKAMQQWCADNYENGADTMVECWSDSDYADLFSFEGEPRTTAQAWETLKSIAAVYQDRQADARNSAF